MRSESETIRFCSAHNDVPAPDSEKSQRQRSRSCCRRIAVSLLRVGFACVLIPSAFAAQTKSYVLSWFVPAMYAHEGDCAALDPVVEPGRGAVESMYRKIFSQLGRSSEEIEKFEKLFAEQNEQNFPSLIDMIVNRGRINGKPVNVFQNPESVPDPQINTVIGKYAIGFNLDGKGADVLGAFEDPYTHEKGVDNQFYRAMGCSRTSRAVSPEKSSQWVSVSELNIDNAPAVLISITGEDLSKDGAVTITFNRAVERTRQDALHEVRRDMTFRVDPNPLTQSTLRGAIKDGVLFVEGGHLMFEGRFATTPFDLTAAHLRLKIKPDGSLDGLLAGYQPWRAIYHFYYSHTLVTEFSRGINISGVYYALKKLADADPDPATGQNRRISATYALRAVPAFVVPHRDQEQTTTALSVRNRDKAIPMATPVGITVQIPAAAAGAFEGYRERKVDIQYYADARGMALYTYDHDKPNQSSCYEECAREWPPLIAPRRAKAFGDWSVVRRKDGRRQWAYQGKPLYTFTQDSVIGETKGVPTPGTRDEPNSPAKPIWQLASYKLAQPVTPHGIFVREIADANGEVLVDVQGMTLYTFDGDPNFDRSSCLDPPCIDSWMPLAAPLLANPVGDFTLVHRKDGTRQWAYKGKGLYRYTEDLTPGDAKGIDVDERWRSALVKQFYLPPQVHIRESFGRGKVLANENGMTLYRRSASNSDGLVRFAVRPEEGRAIGARSCDVECINTWIPFEAPTDAQPSGFWEILTREDGSKQWSYKGYALYRYAGDERPGDVNGNLMHVFASNPQLAAKPDAISQVVNIVKSSVDVPLVWSHMNP